VISGADLNPQLADLGKAIGLLKSDGSVDTTWFNDPLAKLSTILSDAGQRPAFQQLISDIFPPDTILPDLANGEKWHPLLGKQALGNLYLTEMPSPNGGVIFGVAGQIHASDSPPRASLTLTLPIFEAQDGTPPSIQFGQAAFPLKLTARVWLKDLIHTSQVALDAVRVSAILSFQPSLAEAVTVTLEALSIDGGTAADVILDGSNLQAEATHLVLALIQAAIDELSASLGASGEVSAIAQFLLPLLGLSGNVPAFPFTTLASDPQAIQKWFAALVQGETPQIGTWLQNLTGLLGVKNANVTPVGTPPTQWIVPVFDIGSASNSNLAIVVGLQSATNAIAMQIGLQATILPSDPAPPVRIEAQAIFATIPLAGTSSAALLPSAGVTFVAPGDPTKTLGNDTVTVQTMRAGFVWVNSKLQPILELDGVTFAGTSYPHLDLTNAEAVEQAIGQTVAAALGNEIGAHLAALAGLIPPPNAPAGWPVLNPQLLVSNPPRAIAQYHRAALTSGQWPILLNELAQLVGLTMPIQAANSGTQANPWRVPLAAASDNAIALELIAWNAQTSGNVSDSQQLRIGLRAIAQRTPASLQWVSELLGFDLPANAAAGNVTFFAGQHIDFTLSAIPAVPQIAGFTIKADGLQAEMDWAPTTGMKWNAGVTNFSVMSGTTVVALPKLQFPPAAGFDFAHPDTTAAGLGIPLEDFEMLIRLMIARASFSWGGIAGLSLTGLLGVHDGLEGLPVDWPVWEGATPGALFSDPVTALRNWISAIALNVSKEGVPFLMPAIGWLNALLGDALPSDTMSKPPTFDLPLTGSGTYDDPWALPMIAGAPPSAEALVWLDSAAGVTTPPAAWASALLARAGTVTDFPSLLSAANAIAAFYPGLGSALKGLDPDGLATALSALEIFLTQSDGVVPSNSAVPSGGNWIAPAGGTPAITSAHPSLPQNPAAITQILSQIDAWAGGAGGARTVLLLNPNFGGPADWQGLLSNANLHGTTNASATFNLNISGANPETLDLSGVSVSVNYYTATLQDDGTGNVASLQNQIGHIVDRLNEIRGNVPVTIVAHSTAGIPARTYTAANAAKVQGLITLGTPHGGAPLAFLSDADQGNALRSIQRLMPSALPNDQITAALAHMITAIDAYTPSANAGGLPTAAAYPAADFNYTSGTNLDTGGRPALGLAGTLTGSLQDLLSSWLEALGNSAANPATAPAAPTHLCFGLRTHMDTPITTAGEVFVDTSVRFDAFRVKLNAAAAEPARAAQSVRIRSQITRPGAWLVGAASAFSGVNSPLFDVRVRWAEVGVDLQFGANGLTATPQVLLHDASFHEPITDLISFSNGHAQPLLGAVLQTITATAPAANSGLGQWLAWMQALKVVVPDVHGGFGVSADAWNAITADAASFFAAQLPAALSSGSFAGFTGPANGPWSTTIAGMPFELYVSNAPWTIGLRTQSGANGALTLAANASVTFDGHITVSPFSPALDTTVSVGGFSATYSTKTSQLTVGAPPWLAPLPLVPFDSGKFVAALNDALPRLLFSGAASALLEAIVGTSLPIGPLDSFFAAPAAAINNPSGLGASGGGLDPATLTLLLQTINSVAGSGSGSGWVLPGGLQLSASGNNTAAQPTTLTLATTSRFGGVLDLSLTAAFDQNLHVTLGGGITITISPLPGGVWTAVTVNFGVSPSGVTLSVTPQPGSKVQLLPTVSGLSSLAAGATALLPAVLDALLPADPTTASGVVKGVLEVARAFQLYDDAGKFSAHTSQFQALLQLNWTSAAGLTSTAQTAIATAIKDLFNGIAGNFPLTVTSSGGTVTWNFPIPNTNTGTLALTAGWDSSGPAVSIALANFELSSTTLASALEGNASVTISPSASNPVQLAMSLALDLASALPAVLITPEFSIAYQSSGLQVRVWPLATATDKGPLTLNIAPTPSVTTTPALASDLAFKLILPIAGTLAIEACKGLLDQPLWPGATVTSTQVLKGAGLLDNAGAFTLPPLTAGGIAKMVVGSLGPMMAAINVSLPAGLKISGAPPQPSATGGTLVGIALSGTLPIPIDSMTLELHFGAPTAWGPAMGAGHTTDSGLAVYLFDSNAPNPGSFFQPRIDFIGVGLGLKGANDQPLVNTDEFRMEGADLYLFLSWNIAAGTPPDGIGAGLELDQVGLPLGSLSGGGVGGNPVAGSLISSDSGGTGGDSQSVNPGADISAWYIDSPLGDATFHVLISGGLGPLWIPIQTSFGPIYIDQLGVEITSDPGLAMLIDGSVQVAGFTAQADELGVTIPFRALNNPSQWSLDLKGLGVGYSSPGVTIAGALLKNTVGGTIEYDGMLLMQISEYGFVAVGAYSTPTDGGDKYTSLFVFLGAFITITIPPCIILEGFGLGVGYNREIIPPTDMNKIPDFVLVAALDDGGALANDPMGTLQQFSSAFPPHRGSFWLAAGLHASIADLVQVTAVLYIALDRGFEIGVLGVARLALPPDDDEALVNIELALKARFSTAEGVLSIQAQLTDNSYLISPDCQLTGGFAYFMWFPQSQFVLTIGGYNDHFSKPAQFPDVPRVGYHWSLFGFLSIQGGCYFALTNSCIMTGALFDASYGPDWLQLWFKAYADFLASWDPFFFEADIGISVGATFQIQVDLWFTTISVDITVSIGATLTVKGPPLHGELTVDLEIASVTVAFGPESNPNKAPITDWTIFRQKYIYGGDPNGYGVAAHALTGVLTPTPAGAQPAPGAANSPWQLAAEFSFKTESRMPAGSYTDIFGNSSIPGGLNQIDLAPMAIEAVSSTHVITIEYESAPGVWTNVNGTDRIVPTCFAITPVVTQVAEATWHYTDPTQTPAAANTLSLLTGLQIVATAHAQNPTSMIPIGTLVDAENPRPLPFAQITNVPQLQGWGVDADSLSLSAANASSAQVLNAAAQMLSGGGFFAQARQASGLPAAGLSPSGKQSLLRSRSAPPRLAPITTGLTMKPVGLANPPAITVVPPVAPILLTTPRLRAVLQGNVAKTGDAPPPQRTTVSNAAAGVMRVAAPPATSIAGASLLRLHAATAPRATLLGRAGREVRCADFGVSPTSAQLTSLSQAATDFVGQGCTVPAGALHLWDIPQANGFAIAVGGDEARVVCVTRAGTVLSDQEFVSGNGVTVALPPGTAMIAVMCLGKLPAPTLPTPSPGPTPIPTPVHPVAPIAPVAPVVNPRAVVIGPHLTFAGISAAISTQNTMPAVGWQSGNLVAQITSTLLLGRGCCLRLAQHNVVGRANKQTSQAMVKLGAVMLDQPGIETYLPTSVAVVMFLLDRQDPTSTADGDLQLATTGITLATPPLRVEGGARRALIYTVAGRDAKAPYATVAAASVSGWRLSGVLGLPGTAQEWAVRMNGGIPEHLVSDGPFTPDGQIVVQLKNVGVQG
jgi:hypothetical protein